MDAVNPKAVTSEAHAAETRSAAELFVTQLHRSGIDYFFNNGGTDFPPIAEAFAKAAVSGEPVPKPIVVPHENLAVAMAHGVYMISGRVQAVMVHVNVGTANTVNAILDASRDYTPVLLYAGRSPYSESGRHGTRTRYIHWAQEMFDQAGMLREAVKWDYELHLPEQAADLVTRGLQVALTSPRGPVYATLPRDVLAAPVTIDRPQAGRLAPPSPPHPSPADLDTLAAWIASADRPVIVTAAAGRTAAGFAALERFARDHAIPVVSFHSRFLNMASDHPMNLGEQPGPLVREADLVVALDCDVPWIPATDSPPVGCRVVHLGEDPAYTRYPMRSFPSDLCILGETATILSALGERLAALPSHEVAERASRVAGRVSALREKTRGATPPATITPEWLSARIGDAVGPNAIIVNEYPLRLEHCRRSEPGTYFGLSAAGGLGWGLGAALGAKLARPDKLVIATLGDGAYIFANPTAAHWIAQTQDLPILIVVFNNALYGAVRNSTLAMYRDGVAAKDGGRMLAELGPSPAFEMLVEASGGRGFRVERPDELEIVLAEAVRVVTEERRQALVNVICDY